MTTPLDPATAETAAVTPAVAMGVAAMAEETAVVQAGEMEAVVVVEAGTGSLTGLEAVRALTEHLRTKGYLPAASHGETPE